MNINWVLAQSQTLRWQLLILPPCSVEGQCKLFKSMNCQWLFLIFIIVRAFWFQSLLQQFDLEFYKGYENKLHYLVPGNLLGKAMWWLIAFFSSVFKPLKLAKSLTTKKLSEASRYPFLIDLLIGRSHFLNVWPVLVKPPICSCVESWFSIYMRWHCWRRKI